MTSSQAAAVRGTWILIGKVSRDVLNREKFSSSERYCDQEKARIFFRIWILLTRVSMMLKVKIDDFLSLMQIAFKKRKDEWKRVLEIAMLVLVSGWRWNFLNWVWISITSFSVTHDSSIGLENNSSISFQQNTELSCFLYKFSHCSVNLIRRSTRQLHEY